MIAWTFRLIRLWLLRLVSRTQAEQEIRRWNGELEQAMWGPHTKRHRGGTTMAPPVVGEETAARRVQAAMSEWETKPFETDSVSGQSKLNHGDKNK